MGGKKKKTKQQRRLEEGRSSVKAEADDLATAEILETLRDFTLKENWDKFFTLRGSDDSFEWYADWPQLRDLLFQNLSFAASEPKNMSILVPGCGNSKLSEYLYDAGFQTITNVDFSKVVIMNMLKRNVRDRPQMKWRVMDMTQLQFDDGSFNAIVDKGGLDALMEPKLGPGLGNLYLNEVKRVLKAGGKFICLTLAESHVLDLLFPKFRFGWKMSLYALSQKSQSGTPQLQTFVVVAQNDSPTAISAISSFLGEYSIESHGDQARRLYEALEKESKTRAEYAISSDVSYSLEDLKLGVKGNVLTLQPGRRIKLVLGEPGVSNFCYSAMLLDAKEDSGLFSYHYGVFIVPQELHNLLLSTKEDGFPFVHACLIASSSAKISWLKQLRAHDWLYTSEQGQWLIVSSSHAARLLMVFLDSSNSIYSMESIQSDLSPLVMQLAPEHDNDLEIPFLAAGDGIKKRDVMHQVISDMTGPIVVEDVIYEEINSNDPYKGHKYRRLTFERTANLVQSEALLSTKSDSHSSTSDASTCDTEVVIHNHLASPYHNGIISGILLISSYLKVAKASGDLVKTVVVGLGAGLLPMFMKKSLPTLKIEVVELDPVVLDVATAYFCFKEDENLKVHITDGIQFVKKIAKSDLEETSSYSCKIDILVVDVDSSDTSSGLTCPEANFVEESFMSAAKESLSEQGLFILNLVSRSSTVKDAVYSSLKKMFSNIFCLNIDEDVNEVLFALKSDSSITEEQLSEARDIVAQYSEKVKEPWSKKALDLVKSIKRLS